MRKLMLLVAMLAMVLLAAAPAFAQDETKTGNARVGSPSQSNVNACPAAIVQTDNEQDPIQFISGFQQLTIDVEGVGAEAEQNLIESNLRANGFNPEVAAACAAQAVGAAPGGATTAAAPKAAGGGGGGAGAAQLPATGGASLFALGAGALLVAGGLVAHRMIR